MAATPRKVGFPGRGRRRRPRPPHTERRVGPSVPVAPGVRIAVSVRPPVARFPGTRPARALTSRIPLGLGPWLHRLRRDPSPLVRRLHSYYDRVSSMPFIIGYASFPQRPRPRQRDGMETSQVPVQRVRRTIQDKPGPSWARSTPPALADRPMPGCHLLLPAGLSPAALTPVSLAHHQLLAPPLQLPFEVALAHLLCFARRKVGFGLGEGGGRRIPRGRRGTQPPWWRQGSTSVSTSQGSKR